MTKCRFSNTIVGKSKLLLHLLLECKGSQPTSLGTQANLACPRCTLLINERGSGNPPTRTGPARRVMVRTPHMMVKSMGEAYVQQWTSYG
ncbi:unnamed protein product, partial [Iphiclides podalirius]